MPAVADQLHVATNDVAVLAPQLPALPSPAKLTRDELAAGLAGYLHLLLTLARSARSLVEHISLCRAAVRASGLPLS